ncbi:MAG: hypothetical protein H0V34_14190 [Gammaproteobacteria bacterium]|nr:hypothetical protein [Gammaproteobacteria bacterium]
MAKPRSHADTDALAAQVETACRRLVQLVHPDKLTAHPQEAHTATQIILALMTGLADSACRSPT